MSSCRRALKSRARAYAQCRLAVRAEIPIAVPAAEALGLPIAPFLAASLSGGIFGDHASPISDTTIVASLASATDVIDHVRTQLPYALIAAMVAIIGFAIVGALA